MGILVIAEHDNHAIRAATLNAVGAAAQLGGDITLLVAGSNCRAAADAGAGIVGVSKVLHVDAPQYEHGLAEELAPLVVACCNGTGHVLAPANTFGKNLMPRVAALLDVGMIADIVRIEAADTFVRPIYAGNALATVKSNDVVKVISVRTTNFDAADAEGGTATVESLSTVPTRPGCLILSSSKVPKRNAPNSPAQRSSCPEAAASAAARTSACWRRWPTSWARPSAHPVPQLTPAMCPMTTR